MKSADESRHATTVFNGHGEALQVQGYAPDERLIKDIDNRFRYHAPRPDQLPRYELLRERAGQLAHLIATLTPPSREQSLALTKLEEAIMHANSAIARNEG